MRFAVWVRICLLCKKNVGMMLTEYSRLGMINQMMCQQVNEKIVLREDVIFVFLLRLSFDFCIKFMKGVC